MKMVRPLSGILDKVWRLDRLDLFATSLLVAIIPTLFAPLLSRGIRGTPAIVPQSDFPPHSVLAAELREQRTVMIPHPLYHGVLIGVQKGVEVFQGNRQTAAAQIAVGNSRGEVDDEVLAEVSTQYATAAIITNVFFAWLLSMILWTRIRTATAIDSALGTLAGVALVIGLMILTPIALLHVQDGRYYFGYIGINVWHNPTVIAAKPFVLLTFLVTLAGFPEQSKSNARPSWFATMAFAVLVIAGAMAKPSFLLCLVPGVLFMAVLRQWIFSQPVRWTFLLMGLVLPTFLVLGWQSWIYARYTGGAHAIFSPLATMSAMSRHLAPKLLLSILFPVTCYLTWWREARSRSRLNLAWLVFAVGLLFTYLIAETKRTRHGNFLWSAQLALFVLFVESTLFAIARIRASRSLPRPKQTIDWRSALCMFTFSLHVIFGILYCVHLMSSHGENSWLTASWWYH